MQEVRRVTVPEARVMAVVKANAYGHGAVRVAQVALQNGAGYLGVARVQEGIELRRAGIHAPILIFGYAASGSVQELVEYDLTPTVYSYQSAEDLSASVQKIGKKLRVHLKVDSGMGRVGLPTPATAENADDSAKEAVRIAALPGIELEGVYTHFASADHRDKSSAVEQLERFSCFLAALNKAGIEAPIKHAANSAAIIDLPEAHFDMVRAGIMLYGLYPSEEVDRARVLLKPAMQLRSRVTQVKRVPAGFKVSYGSTYETRCATQIATVAIGYADGYDRLLSSRGSVLIHGRRAPVVGRVCMDQTMIDVGSMSNVLPGDEVTLFGKQGDQFISVDEVASAIDTINYEIVSTIMPRVPRIYHL